MGTIDERGTAQYVLTMAEDVGAARRAARDLALRQGACDADVGRVELVTTELGTNTLCHATPPGYLLIQSLASSSARGVEILAVDHGPGIEHLAEVLHGVASRFAKAPETTGRGLGCGLSSVRRLATEFDVHTLRGKGTVVLARFHFDAHEQAPRGFRVGAVSVPLAGETENGDGWGFALQPGGCAVMVADGLGHGPHAALASSAALTHFHAAPLLDVERFLTETHAALRGTRGAAVSVCRILVETNRLQFAGLGNVEGRTQLAASSEGLAPRSGTLGMNITPPQVRVRELVWEPGATLLLHSDGVRHLHDLAAQRDLIDKDPSVIAAVLHRELTRGRDDATVVVVQDTRPQR
ncbi:MAG: SpoIIE family protein phosphatase [Polyangiales bacterium]